MNGAPPSASPDSAEVTRHLSLLSTTSVSRGRTVEEHVSRPPIAKEQNEMQSTSKTVVALTVTAVSLVVAVGAGASGSVTPADEDYASPELIQLGHGPGGPAAATDRGFEYGSADLIQLGHGPGGPSKAPLGS
jgi:hypothetical protein